jgi:hypothetical protein
VDIMTKLKLRNSWRIGLIIATGLNALAFAASLLWQAGQAEWGFALLFGTSWVLISLLLSNDDFNEESGVILARILDENVDHLQARIGSWSRRCPYRTNPARHSQQVPHQSTSRTLANGPREMRLVDRATFHVPTIATFTTTHGFSARPHPWKLMALKAHGHPGSGCVFLGLKSTSRAHSPGALNMRRWNQPGVRKRGSVCSS